MDSAQMTIDTQLLIGSSFEAGQEAREQIQVQVVVMRDAGAASGPSRARHPTAQGLKDRGFCRAAKGCVTAHEVRQVPRRPVTQG